MVISFIIPVYNVEKYLNQCVNSILSQTYRDIEIILVDDGSPDNCPFICDEYASKDNRVKVVHKTNGGLSDARNVGLITATGDYVIFVDSDDFWKNELCLDRLVREVKSSPNCDFIGFNCSYYLPSSNKNYDWVKYDDVIVNETPTQECILHLLKSGTFPMSACLKMIKRQFLIDNQLFFIKGVYSEDIPWFIDLLQKSSLCRFVNEYIYCYRKEVSTSISSTFSMKKWTDLYNHLVKGVEKIKQRELSKTTEALYSFWAYEYYILIGMLGFMESENRSKYCEKLLYYDWLTQYDINPKVKKVNIVRKLLGNRITNQLLYYYLKTKVSK